MLRDNGGDDLPVSANGSFTFATPLASGATINVTVRTQPTSPAQTCTVIRRQRDRAQCHRHDRLDRLRPPTPTPWAARSPALAGSGLVLRNNGGDDLPVSANGTFTFSTPLASGASYSVTVLTQPTSPEQTCTVAGGSGTVPNAVVTTVSIVCVTNTYTVGGTVAGLAGSGLVLRNNGGDDLPVSANGTFTFATPLASGATYSVTVLTQPTSPAQTCTVAGGSGTVPNAVVTTVSIVCVTNTYTVGGTVTGLAGSGLVLRNNGGDDLPVSANGSFTFATPLASGASYSVTIFTQPTSPAQTCAVTGGSGTVGNAPITTAMVTCVTDALIGAFFVYTANAGDNTVSAFTADAITGASGRCQAAPTLLACTSSTKSSAAPAGASSTLVHTTLTSPAAGGVAAYRIDPTSGALAAAGATQVSGSSNFTVSPNGKLAYAISRITFPYTHYTYTAAAVDAISGALTRLSSGDLPLVVPPLP